MHRFTIKRKISDTVLGATYECERRAMVSLPALARAIKRKPVNHLTPVRALSTVVVKCASLRRRDELVTAAKLYQSQRGSVYTNHNGDDDDEMEDDDNNQLSHFALDDPHRERVVVAKLIASGGHQNVLQCYDHFTTTSDNNGGHDEDDTHVYIVTEFCSGGDLFDYLRASPTGSLCERESLAMIAQVANGLAFLHRQGFAHRDLSLENVLLRDGTCKLADFGAASAAKVRCSDCVGKQQYMAPEVVAMADVAVVAAVVCEAASVLPVPLALVLALTLAPTMTQQTPLLKATYDPVMADVWSLGVMLFILLTGSPLVNVASRRDPRFVALETHGMAAILAAWGLSDQHVSHEVVMLLESMLQVDPTKRITVLELLDRLPAVLAY